MNKTRVALANRLVKKNFRMPQLAWENTKPSSSIYGEDVFLWSLFHDKKNGFYVDVGAYHPVKLSNTYFLKKRNHWRGINIDPNIDSIRLFNQYRPDDINVQVAITNEDEGYVDYFKYDASEVNTLSQTFEEEKISPVGHKKIGEEKVRTQRLVSVLDEHLPPGQTIDLMDIDCEGYDLQVLASNNWDKYRPGILLVEDCSGEVSSEVTAYCQNIGYQMISWLADTKVFRDTAK